MKNKIIILISLLILFVSSTFGEHRYETLVLQDGSHLEGYIISQSSRHGIKFQAERSYIKIPKEAITISIDSRISYAALSDVWKEWVNEDKKVLNKNHEILLSEITIDNKYSAESVTDKKKNYFVFKQVNTYHQVRFISNGDVCEFLDIADRKYQFSWDEIAEIKTEIPDPMLLNGLVTIIETNYKQYKGNIVSQIPGESLSIMADDGIVFNLETSSIKKIYKEPINEKETLEHQTLLVETIELNNKEKVSGVITEQDFVPRADGSTSISIKQFDGTFLTYNRNDVTQIQRKLNNAFVFLYDVILEQGQMKIGPDSIVSFSELNNKNGIVYTNDNHAKYVFSLNDLEDKELCFYVNDGKDMQDFKLMKLSDQPSLQERKKTQIPKGFSFEEFAIYAQDSDSDILMPSGTHLFKYKVDKPGLFVLYQAKQKRGILFELK